MKILSDILLVVGLICTIVVSVLQLSAIENYELMLIIAQFGLGGFCWSYIFEYLGDDDDT